MKKLGKFISRILLGINIVLLLLVIFGHFSIPEYPAGYYWPLGLLGLVYPILVFFVFIYILFWIIFHYKYAIWGIITLTICWSSVAVCFSLFSGSKDDISSAESIQVISYNVHYFRELGNSQEENQALRSESIAFLKKKNPDIVCMQEFYSASSPHLNSLAYISEQLSLPYHYFSGGENDKSGHSGVVLFSRYPIIAAQRIELPESGNKKERIVYADIVKEEDTLRVFSVHLQSIYLSSKDLQNIEEVKSYKKDSVHLGEVKGILGKLKRAFKKRSKEADILAEKIKESPYPVLVCGDFNDPPNSYSYAVVSHGLKDAFLEKGFGLGRTFRKLSPTLRIDYIFTSPSIDILTFSIMHVNYSDHYPISSKIVL